MADAIQAIPFTVPAGSGSNAAHGLSTPLGSCTVTQITLAFPPGCAGLVGARFIYAGNVVYPTSSSQWFVFDDYNYVIAVSNQQTSGQWSMQAYNEDFYPHTVTAYYEYNYLPVGFVPPSISAVSL